jgi:hypothetical protein
MDAAISSQDLAPHTPKEGFIAFFFFASHCNEAPPCVLLQSIIGAPRSSTVASSSSRRVVDLSDDCPQVMPTEASMGPLKELA